MKQQLVSSWGRQPGLSYPELGEEVVHTKLRYAGDLLTGESCITHMAELSGLCSTGGGGRGTELPAGAGRLGAPVRKHLPSKQAVPRGSAGPAPVRLPAGGEFKTNPADRDRLGSHRARVQGGGGGQAGGQDRTAAAGSTAVIQTMILSVLHRSFIACHQQTMQHILAECILY